MTGRPRKGRRVAFQREDGLPGSQDIDPISGLRFTIGAQHGGEALVDFTGLRPRRLALAFARALRHLAAPGGPLGVRATVKAYAVALPRFFDYLRESGGSVDGPEDLQGQNVDGFETWLEVHGYSRTHLFTVLVKVIAVLRQIAIDSPDGVSPNLRDRLRYASARPFQRSRPRDAYSPFVARQLRDAARGDAAAVIRRMQQNRSTESDAVLLPLESAAHALIEERGIIRSDDTVFEHLCSARRRCRRSNKGLGDELNGRHHLSRDDVIPFLVLLALETGLEIECCKALNADCLQNASGGTVEIAYFKRRARGSEHKRLRVRDGALMTPGGLIRKLLELTASARRHHPSNCIWVYRSAGAFTAGIRHPRMLVDAWTRRHGIVDDDGRPLQLLLSRLRKTHKALWYLKTEGHMARFAVGHTPEVAARHYADVPALRPLHQATVAEALQDAVSSAFAPLVLTPEQEEVWRGHPATIANVSSGSDLDAPLVEEQDVWLASCGGFYAGVHGEAGAPCPVPFWGCLECSCAVITARKLPAILSFLAFIEDRRRALPADDWRTKFGRAYARIVNQILPSFSDTVIENARESQGTDECPIYLPPEALQ